MDDLISRIAIIDKMNEWDWQEFYLPIHFKELLDELPAVSLCTDAISRQAVLDGLASIAKAKAKSDAQKSLMGRIMFFVEQLPSVSTEKTGRWILTSDYEYEYCTCSECGYQNEENWIIGSRIKYCPNCGAKMEVEE